MMMRWKVSCGNVGGLGEVRSDLVEGGGVDYMEIQAEKDDGLVGDRNGCQWNWRLKNRCSIGDAATDICMLGQ